MISSKGDFRSSYRLRQSLGLVDQYFIHKHIDTHLRSSSELALTTGANSRLIASLNSHFRNLGITTIIPPNRAVQRVYQFDLPQPDYPSQEHNFSLTIHPNTRAASMGLCFSAPSEKSSTTPAPVSTATSVAERRQEAQNKAKEAQERKNSQFVKFSMGKWVVECLRD
jgi:hypothetical protein